MRFRSFIAACTLMLLAGCSHPEQQHLSKLNIEAAEVGDVPASTVPNLPAEQDVVAFSHGPGPTSTAVYRHTIPVRFE
jgi:hypothetical protein